MTLEFENVPIEAVDAVEERYGVPVEVVVVGADPDVGLEEVRLALGVRHPAAVEVDAVALKAPFGSFDRALIEASGGRGFVLFAVACGIWACTLAWKWAMSDNPHRRRRLRGEDVRFLSGTDDNSLKSVEAAEALTRAETKPRRSMIFLAIFIR